MGWSYSSYIRNDQNYFRPGAEAQLTDLDLQLRGRVRPLRLYLNVRNTYRIGENNNYVKPYELFVPFEAGSTQIQVGRVLKPWSQTDAYWEQGLWQPRFLDDKFRQEFAGLTGVFAEQRFSFGQAMVWASPLHVPEFGAHHSIEDGHFVSGNPWFNTPTTIARIQGKDTQISYRVDYPDVSDIVFNPGAGINLKTESMWLENFSYAYKPMPQLLYGFPFYLELGESSEQTRLNIEINPRLVYHHLATWEVGEELGSGRWRGSFTYEKPERDSTPENWITQETQEAYIAALTWEQAMGPGFVDLGWLRVWGGDQPDQGEFAPDGTLFEKRYQFLHAVRLGWKSVRFDRFGWGWSGASRFTYDFEQAGLVWINEVQAEPIQDLALLLRADFLGLTGDKNREEDTFINSYRANDRIQAGLRYVF